MKTLAAHIHSFARAETGAVTVDWVVLTSGIVALGLAVITVVSGGMASLASDTSDTIADTPIRTRFATVTSLFSGDFSNGAGGWLGGTVTSVAGFGDVLQIGPQEMAELSLNVPPGSSQATVTFDLIAADDFDGDPATIFINGQAVAVYVDNHGNITTSENAPAGMTVSVQQQYTNNNVGAGSHGADSRATYTITIDDPGTSLTVGVHSDASAGVSNEFFALDDVSVTAR
ncbi:hypothetical protein HKCCE2091_09550 [Rhodobacterales bacterium HKCCE2091]|nr:hypothetical protein [Rhodobacterales bacterium HKCCE2091]